MILRIHCSTLYSFLFGCVFISVKRFEKCISAAEEVASVSASCDAKLPKVLLGDQMVVVDESRFPKHYGSYPPKGSDMNDDSESLSYYVLNAEKSVLYVPNFMNQTVIEEMKEFCISGERFVRSPIRGTTSNPEMSVQEHQVRTSESCTMVPTVLYRKSPKVQAMFADDPMPPQVAKVAREVDISWDVAVRASKLLGVDPETVEPLQLVRYTSPNAEYKLHHDHGGFFGKATEHRLWTMLVFLSDVAEGGHTAFPKLKLEIVPRMGDALVWSNVQQDKDGVWVVDEDMVHAGRPPADGSHKYALNVWFGYESSEQRMQEGKWG
ncbi:2-oxyglutarate/Fe(II) oxygenase [Nitzschia inconspicua]|uniref:2-oxyglutarate/Fe(II) oxygenase n=1 Tax=Nitzschia inconspicua TaxID=303405 RepID=A0A9K3L4F9_9STRA|nr:2-oxyglutarate/Fe(II) oxygenase [Nitzschia inconspicua]